MYISTSKCPNNPQAMRRRYKHAIKDNKCKQYKLIRPPIIYTQFFIFRVGILATIFKESTLKNHSHTFKHMEPAIHR